MSKILDKKQLSQLVYQLELEAPEIAEKRKPGQFIILRVDKTSERVPLTIADADTVRGSITIIVQAVGKSTMKLVSMNAGESIEDLVGPLGTPTDVHKVGTVVMVGGGVGIAPLHPIAKAFKDAGNTVISILGARNKDLIILEDNFRKFSDQLIVVTDDGSAGEKGLVTNALQGLIDKGVDIKEVVTIGPMIMMKFVSELTRKYKIKTLASLNSMMIDGTGMCGGCRVTVGGETKFTCVHGPEFDAHLVDFDTLLKRSGAYKHEEKCRLDAYMEEKK